MTERHTSPEGFSHGSHEARRVVIMSPALPEEAPEHAGGVLLREVTRCLSQRFHITVIAPSSPQVHRTTPASWISEVIIIPREGVLSKFDHGRISQLRMLRPPLWTLHSAWKDSRVRAALKAADIVDLQWQEQGAFIPLVRRFAPDALVVVTLHDVISQRELRAAHGGTDLREKVRKSYRLLRSRIAGQAEKVLTGASPFARASADRVVVLSEKDSLLLPDNSRAQIFVSRPGLVKSGDALVHAPAERPTILLVAYLARWPNEEGLRWFLQSVLPLIRAERPDVRMIIAGGGIRPTVREDAAKADAELLGYVPDLSPLYSEADVAVVPLLQGAGVKFKTVEALSAGTPVVTTPIGAEGIGDREWYAGVETDPRSFAARVLQVLEDPAAARQRARNVRDDLVLNYGEGQFNLGLERIYEI